MTAHNSIIPAVRAQLESSAAPDWDAILATILDEFQCMTGTIHRLSAESGLLELVAQRGIPDAIMQRVARIPIGKGMAGLAAERREPVQVCNLQTDDSGKAKPGAKLTQMAGSIAAPIIVDGELRGTLGVARPDEYEFSNEQITSLLTLGALIGARLNG
ncbi:MAG: GAF domain-containing protein [Phycisphaerales bacterium]|nr:GAF domain-containing protein [Phycisphaerales bacterium]MCB9864656.1 GAF domain-containing protein [Phycisphaerales bacterium]